MLLCWQSMKIKSYWKRRNKMFIKFYEKFLMFLFLLPWEKTTFRCSLKIHEWLRKGSLGEANSTKLVIFLQARVV